MLVGYNVWEGMHGVGFWILEVGVQKLAGTNWLGGGEISVVDYLVQGA